MNTKWLKVLSTVFLILLVFKVRAQDPNFHIYLCFGQSNMNGAAAFEAQDTTVNKRFKVLQAMDCADLGRVKAEWYTANPPLCRCNSGLSPADYFGRTMVDHLPEEIEIGVINLAIPGCDIRLFDKDIYAEYYKTHEKAWFMKSYYCLSLRKMLRKLSPWQKKEKSGWLIPSCLRILL